ncbi:MAG: M1 family metallopeptidase [Pseudonocardia sp.]
MRRSILVATLVLLLVGGVIVVAALVAPRPVPRAGDGPGEDVPTAPVVAADGLGDPYYPQAGNAGYDVLGYDIDLTYEPRTDRLDGITTVTAVATQALRGFSLDLRLPASAVEVDGAPAAFTQDDGELHVTPAVPVAEGASMRVLVTYGGIPSELPSPGGIAAPWTRARGGVAAVGQPEGASWWFPANDHPSDKATVAVNVSVPEGVEAISNGALLGGPEPTPDGRDRWRWRADEPMAPYLAFVVIGQYELDRRDTPLGPYVGAYPADASPRVITLLDRTPQVAETLAEIFGPYPFGQLGGVAAPIRGFALENQTRPVYAESFLDSRQGASVVVHELAHQWFGDSVALARWRDIWLNEGFATYAEWLYDERTGGPPAVDVARGYYEARPADDDFWTVPPGDPGREDLFDRAVYVRGGMAVQAIRSAVGDEDFFAILRAWPTERRGANGTVEDFLTLAERISGEDLDAVAREWLYDADRPPAPPG